MLQQIEKYFLEIKNFNINNLSDLEQFRLLFLSKKGILAQLFASFKTLSSEDKKNIGLILNQLKNEVVDKYQTFKDSFAVEKSSLTTDLTLPSEPIPLGSRHPVSLIRKEIITIFSKIGFTVAEGPEIEDDWHVFSGLNFPLEHPARDMQDTFFIESDFNILLRTHTSSVQVRVMETEQPPIRKIFPGRVFRNEAISARAHCIFHQI
jgi:phenylalanyl-tRNA synthetase alpha chain